MRSSRVLPGQKGEEVTTDSVHSHLCLCLLKKRGNTVHIKKCLRYKFIIIQKIVQIYSSVKKLLKWVKVPIYEELHVPLTLTHTCYHSTSPPLSFIYFARRIGNKCRDLLKSVQLSQEIQFVRQKWILKLESQYLVRPCLFFSTAWTLLDKLSCNFFK